MSCTLLSKLKKCSFPANPGHKLVNGESENKAMRATLNASRPPPNSEISLVGMKKLSTGFDPETFLAKAGVGKTVVNLKKKDAAPSNQPSHWFSLSIESSTRPAGARNSSFFSSRASHWRFVTSNTAPNRFETVSSGPKIRKLR